MPIRDLRKRKGYTQQVLAAKVNVSQQTIARYESKQRTPSIRMAKRIASVLGVSWTDIYDDLDEAQTNNDVGNRQIDRNKKTP